MRGLQIQKGARGNESGWKKNGEKWKGDAPK